MATKLAPVCFRVMCEVSNVQADNYIWVADCCVHGDCQGFRNADLLPVSWFGEQSGGSEYYRIVGSEGCGAYWLFALVAGIVISAAGLALRFIK